MGEGIVAAAPHIIVSVGIGSCVVVVLYDATRKAGGLAHIMLPSRSKDLRFESWELGEAGIKSSDSELPTPNSKLVYQFADTAIPALLEEMRKLGCQKQNIVASMAGGARMFPSYAVAEAGVGEQNIRSVRHLLEQEGIPLKGRDTGGSHGRTVELHLETGRVVVKAFGKEDREV